MLAVAIALPCSLAQEGVEESSGDIGLSKYDVHMHIALDSVLVESRMLFDGSATTNFSVELPYDASSINNRVDGFSYPAILDFNRLLFYLKGERLVEYEYITEELLEGESLIATINVPLDADDVRVRVSLPEGATLEKPLRKGRIAGSAIYPKPTRLETDGQLIMVVWEFEDVEAGEELAFFVNYDEPGTHWSVVLLLILISLLIFILLVFLIVRPQDRKGKRSPQIVVRQFEKQGKDIDTHLKDDEQQVVNVLRLKEGRCEQGTLRIATGFSKAKLSGLLKEMESRNIVHKEKRGKKNLVFLKE